MELAKTSCVYLICAIGAWLACLTPQSPIAVAATILFASDLIKATRHAFEMKRVTEKEALDVWKGDLPKLRKII